MDGLALLCNLHAEGPATLSRLRNAEVHDLRQVEALGEHELARILGSSPPAAARFAREAALLMHRLGESDAARPITVEAEPVFEMRPAPPPLKSQRTTPAYSRRAAPERVAPEPAPGTLLRPGLFEGLTSRICERLIGQGVRTVRDLLRTANLNLARRIALSYPKLLDLSYEARQYVARPSVEQVSQKVAEVVLTAKAASRVEEAGAAGPFA